MALQVAVVGASGYAGAELMRLIENHPELELRTVTANTHVGQKVSELVEGLGKAAELVFQETTAEALLGAEVVFLALPHTMSARVIPMIPVGAIILDCGADFRIESKEQFEKFYQAEHAGSWSYGLPELLINTRTKQRERLVGEKRIAVPGCNATAVTLAFAPLLAAGLVQAQDLVSTLAVGTSGAGRNAEVNSKGIHSAFPYQVGGSHRHIPEILQNLQRLSADEANLTFTPVLVPIFRGILAVNSAEVRQGVGADAIARAFEVAYASEPFIELLPAGQFPDTKNVELTNRVQIGFALDQQSSRVTVISAIDNLVKGTAGAAIQCLNLALGWQEQTGLEF